MIPIRLSERIIRRYLGLIVPNHELVQVAIEEQGSCGSLELSAKVGNKKLTWSVRYSSNALQDGDPVFSDIEHFAHMMKEIN